MRNVSNFKNYKNFLAGIWYLICAGSSPGHGGGAPYPVVPGTILLYATKKCAEKNIGIPKKCRKKYKLHITAQPLQERKVKNEMEYD